MGGAQMILYEHLRANKINGVNSYVVSVLGKDFFSAKILGLNIPIYHLELTPIKSFFSKIKSIFKLFRIVNNIKPDLIASSMLHANFLTSICLFFKSKNPIVWTIHNSNLSFKRNTISTYFFSKLNAIISYLSPSSIIYCSEYARKVHEDFGYNSKISFVIQNAIDLNKFSPSVENYYNFRKELKVEKDTFIIGSVGRYHPIKDYMTFVNFAKIINDKHPNIAFVLCGEGLTWENDEIVSSIIENKLKSVFHLVGRKSQINKVTSAFDISINTSLDESFSLTTAEAMACEVPCVVSNIASLRKLMGTKGFYADVKNPNSFAFHCFELINASQKERRAIGQSLRRKVEKKLSLKDMNNRYIELYRSLLQGHKG